MGTNLEVVVSQKRHLITLLKIKRANTGVIVQELDTAITEAKAEMQAEDVAYVEKTVNGKS